MVLALVVGDLHVPNRSAGIPEAFRKMFVPGRIKYVFITGNICCRDLYNYFRTVGAEVYCTRGEYDSTWGRHLPETAVVEVEGLKFGLVHGHQVIPAGDKDALAIVQRQLGVDVLLSGATHVTKVWDFGGNLFVNPGSITGAMIPTETEVVPSFILLDVRGKAVTAFTYRFLPNEVEKNDSADDDNGDSADSPSSMPEDDKKVRIKKKDWVKE